MAIKNQWVNCNIFVVIFFCMQLMGNIKGELECNHDCFENQNRTHVCKETFKTTIYYYDALGLTCRTSNCYKSKKHAVFESVKDCEEMCANCPILLKKFKPNDECLNAIDILTGNSTELIKEPMNRWVFDNSEGKCVPYTVNDAARARGIPISSDWSLKGGLLFFTKQECEKRCPPVV